MNAELITALLLQLQPHRGTTLMQVLTSGVTTRKELRELERTGYLTIDGDTHVHFTTKAYSHLKS